VSSVFNFKGPSLTIDTLCSSSMVAVHEACRSLCAGDCDVALAGGVNFLMSPYYLFVLNRMQLLSRTGLSRPFDPQADGFVPSEGGAVFCLKRLPDALADGDPIRAVIAGSAIVHHGPSAGLTVPDAAAMAQAMRDALGAAAAEPASVDLVQAMGAGNRLSDGAELEALCNVFATSDRAEPIALSCEKGAIGHLESASGAAGLVALILELERHMRFPLHSGGAAPALGVAGLRAVHHPEDWIADRPRRAALDSFSMTGTLVHLIVEEAPVPARSDHSAGWLILPISADNEVDLATQAAAYAVAIARLSPDAIADACFTAATGRRHGRHRAAIVAAGRDALIKGLTAVTTRSVADGSGVTVIRGRIGAPLYGFPIRRARASRVDARRQVDRIACEQAAQGFAAGEPVAWDALQSGRRRRIRMPKTRLERQTYLFEPANDAPQRPAAPVARAALHPLLSGARRG